MYKKTLPFLLINIFLSCCITIPAQSLLDFEMSYGIINTTNKSNLNSYLLPHLQIETLKEENLQTFQLGIAAKVNLNKRHSFKIGVGKYENGRTLTVNYTDFHFLPTTTLFSNSIAKYQFYTLSFSHLLNFDLPRKFQLNIENGLMGLKTYNYLDIRFYSIEIYNFQYFLKVGVSKRITNKINCSLRSTFFNGFKNFSIENIEEGFIPFSYGGEVSVAIDLLEKSRKGKD